MKCFACEVTERLALATCCGRLCCPSHRFGDGSLRSGFTCSDHPFGMAYELRKGPAARGLRTSGRWWNRMKAWLFKGRTHE